MRFVNPRSAKSFLSFFTPLAKYAPLKEETALNTIQKEIDQFERQDIVESALLQDRAYQAISMLEGNLRQKLHINELADIAKILKKTWEKISLAESDKANIDKIGAAEWSPLQRTASMDLLNRLRDMRRSLNHYGDLLKTNARFKELFRNSRISFSTQPLDETLEKMRVLEEKLEAGGSEEAYLKAVKRAETTHRFLDVTPDLVWFRIENNSCPFEADMMGHCASEGGTGTNLFSLREKRGKYFYPVVTAAWHPIAVGDKGVEQGYLTQIKGPKNSKPLPKWYPAILKLLYEPIVGFLKRSTYKPELDFSIDDLKPEDRKKLLEKKPTIESWKIFVGSLAIKGVANWAADQMSTHERSDRVNVIGKDTVELFSADDPKEFWVDMVGELVHKDMKAELKRLFEWADDEIIDVHISSDDVPVKDMLYFLEKKHPKLFSALNAEAVKIFEAEVDGLEEFIRSDEGEKIFDAFSDAYRQGMEIGYQADAYRKLMSGLDDYQFYNANGNESVRCVRDSKKKYHWSAIIDKVDLVQNLVEYDNQEYTSDILDFMFMANNSSGELAFKDRRNRNYFFIEDVFGEYDEDAANERLLETLYEIGIRENKKEKNPTLQHFKKEIKHNKIRYTVEIRPSVKHDYYVATIQHEGDLLFYRSFKDFKEAEMAIMLFLDSPELTSNPKSVKFKKMSYKDLIREHKNLVAILKSGDKKKISREMLNQEKELREYIKESKAK